MGPVFACLLIAAGHGDALLTRTKKDLEYYATFKAHWPGSAFPDQYQSLKVQRIDAKGITLVKHLAYSTDDPHWNQPDTWTSTWGQFGRIDVITNKGGHGGPSIGLRTERQTAKGPYYLFFSFTLLDNSTAKAIAEELKNVATKYGSPLR